MNRGLRFLLRREAIGRVRAAVRRLRTPRGALGALGIALFLVAIGLGRLLRGIDPEAAPTALVGAAGMRELGPLALLGLAGLNALAGRGLYFRPAEIGALFPAPLSRRELVAYNVLARARLAALSALWLALVIEVENAHFAAVLVGGFAALLFVQVASQLASVVSAWLAERLPRAARIGLLGLALAVALGPAWGPVAAAAQGGAGAVAAALARSPVIALLGAPARPCLELMLATTLPAALAWGALSLAVVLACVEAIARLDVAYAEAAFAGSRALERSRARMRSGGGTLAASRGRARFRLPRPPRLGGAGPLAWRNAQELVRNPRGVLSMLVAMGLAVAGAVLGPALSVGHPEARAFAARLGVGLVVLLSVLLTQNFAFDFRRDLDRMALLKALPIPGVAIAAGQLAAAALFTALLQLAGVGLVAAATGAFPARALAALALPLPALAWAAVCVDNAIFLLWPQRSVPEDPGDMGFLGRNMLVMALKVALLASLVAAAGIGAIHGARLAGGGPLAAGALALSALALAGVPLTLLVAWAFARFDVSRDVPA